MFIDAYPPASIMKFGFVSSPRFSTSITAVANGSERRNRNWASPLHTFAAPDAIECHEDLVALHDMWMAMAGPLHTFPFRDPLDFASRALPAADVEPEVGLTDSVLGIGDGFNREFQLIRSYAYGTASHDRPIHLPVVDSVIVGINATPAADYIQAIPGVGDVPMTWSVDRGTGIVTFDYAPNEGLIITAGFLFDVEVRFEGDDSYDGIVRSWRVSGHADLVFSEVRPC